jgi:hypothetical protein
MNGLQTILDKQKDTPLKVTEIKRIRELVMVNNIMGTVESEGQPDEIISKHYSVWFKTFKEAQICKDALTEGKQVLVTIKEVGSRWGVIKNAIRKPPVEIPEPSLEEQHSEVMGLGNDY